MDFCMDLYVLVAFCLVKINASVSDCTHNILSGMTDLIDEGNVYKFKEKTC